jgi:hypothetical protein
MKDKPFMILKKLTETYKSEFFYWKQNFVVTFLNQILDKRK